MTSSNGLKSKLKKYGLDHIKAKTLESQSSVLNLITRDIPDVTVEFTDNYTFLKRADRVYKLANNYETMDKLMGTTTAFEILANHNLEWMLPVIPGQFKGIRRKRIKLQFLEMRRFEYNLDMLLNLEGELGDIGEALFLNFFGIPDKANELEVEEVGINILMPKKDISRLLVTDLPYSKTAITGMEDIINSIHNNISVYDRTDSTVKDMHDKLQYHIDQLWRLTELSVEKDIPFPVQVGSLVNLAPGHVLINIEDCVRNKPRRTEITFASYRGNVNHLYQPPQVPIGYLDAYFNYALRQLASRPTYRQRVTNIINSLKDVYIKLNIDFSDLNSGWKKEPWLPEFSYELGKDYFNSKTLKSQFEEQQNGKKEKE